MRGRWPCSYYAEVSELQIRVGGAIDRRKRNSTLLCHLNVELEESLTARLITGEHLQLSNCSLSSQNLLIPPPFIQNSAPVMYT